MVSSSSHDADNERFTKWAAQRFQTAENWTRSKQAYLIIFLDSPHFQSLELWNECLRPFPHLDYKASRKRPFCWICMWSPYNAIFNLLWRGRKAHFLHACIEWRRYLTGIPTSQLWRLSNFRNHREIKSYCCSSLGTLTE